MDQAKATINLKEGTIQLEGPVEFVRHYLNAYQSVITGQGAAPAAVAAPSAPAIVEAPRRGRRKGRRGLSCGRVLNEEIDSGFFKDFRSVGEVKDLLVDRGVTCSDNMIRISLRKLAGQGHLDRQKEGRTARYRHKA